MGEGSDGLQLIKFWLSCAPGKGLYGGAKVFGSALLRQARSVCVSPSAFFHFDSVIVRVIIVVVVNGGGGMLCQMSITDDAVPREQPDAGGTVRDDSPRRLRRHRRNTARPSRHAKSVASLMI